MTRMKTTKEVAHAPGLITCSKNLARESEWRTWQCSSKHTATIPSLHRGSGKMLDLLRLRFVWLKCPVTRNCTVSLARNVTQPKPLPAWQGLLQNFVATQPFHTVHCDFIGPLPRTASGFQYVCVFIDNFTRWVRMMSFSCLLSCFSLIFPLFAFLLAVCCVHREFMVCFILRHCFPFRPSPSAFIFKCPWLFLSTSVASLFRFLSRSFEFLSISFVLFKALLFLALAPDRSPFALPPPSHSFPLFY